MEKLALILSAVVLASCASRRMETTERHADSVAVLRAFAASTLARVETWERIILAPDTAGTLRPVSHEIVRHTATAAETRTDTAAAIVHATETRHTETAIEQPSTPDKPDWRHRLKMAAFLAVLWVLFAFTAIIGVFAIWKKWTSRH